MNSYPEINIAVLEDVVSRWASRYSSIKKITLYPHKGGHPNDQDKLFLIDICLDNDAPLHHITQIDSECCPIDSSLFFNELLRAKAQENSYNKKQWEIFYRQEKDHIPYPFIAGGGKGLGIFSRPDNPMFPELNIDFLKVIAKRWAKKYRKRGVIFDRILLYRYASDFHEMDAALEQIFRKREKDFSPSDGPEYAVVFELLNYERKHEFLPDGHNEIHQAMADVAEDPYEKFFTDIGFRVGDKKKLNALIYNGFKGVYQSGRIPNDHNQEWIFLPQYKNLALDSQVRTSEGHLILYSGTTDYERLKTKFREDTRILLEKRDEKFERGIWDKNIEPISKLHFKSALEYEFFPEPATITQGHLNFIWEKLLWHCDPYDGYKPENFKTDIMDMLKANMPDTKRRVGIKGLREIFHSFLKQIIEDKTLPLFLMYLYYECGAKSSIASSPNIKQDQFKIPVPSGTTWGQIHFRIVNSDRVEVSYPKGMKPFSPDDIGLLKKRRLHDLFEKFAHEAYQDADRQDIYDLNTFLKRMFPAIDDGNPIIKAKPEKKSLKEKKDHLKLNNPTGYTPVFSIQPE